MALNRLQAAWIALVLFLAAPRARSQSADAALNLPDAPYPSLQAAGSQTNSAPPANGSSSQTSPASATTPSGAQTSPPVTAEEQLKQQEKQRILGVMATFNTTQNHNALPLSPRQKFQLFFKSVTDPWPFALTAVVAGISQADDDFSAYGQGVEGRQTIRRILHRLLYRQFFGNAVLPSLLHEDPRYYQRGRGSVLVRALWAAGSTGWCKRDDGTWGPNYANVTGNLIGAAISNVYYPEAQRSCRTPFSADLPSLWKAPWARN